MTPPADWLWIVVVSVATFAATQIWPWARALVDSEFAARRDLEDREKRRELQDIAARDERFVKAQESLAVSNRQIADTLIALQFETAATSREVRELRADLARSGAIDRRARRKIQAPKGDA